MEPLIRSVGEAAVLAVFGDAISPDTQRRIEAVQHYTESHPFPGYIESIVSYTGFTIYYDPWEVARSAPGKRPSEVMQSLLRDYCTRADAMEPLPKRHISIPVCYGGEYGPDLPFVARYHHMTEEEVIAIHTAPEYLVYMIGFCPGFPYLGGMDPRIATPRRQNPRLVIPAGSIGIAGEQTGGYPIATPGGWQLIGQTPVPMFRPENPEEPTLLRAGDLVRFTAISEEEYRSMEETQ